MDRPTTVRPCLAFVLVAALGVVSCRSAPRAAAPDAAVVRDIEEHVRRYDAAVNAGDVDALMALWADDAVMIPPEGPVVRGKAACRANIAALFAEYRAEVHSTIQHVDASGDLAVAHLHYRATSAPKAGGDTVAIAGQWVNVYRRQPGPAGGRWLLVMEIWNAAGPADPPDAASSSDHP